jgi:hypothetical protein
MIKRKLKWVRELMQASISLIIHLLHIIIISMDHHLITDHLSMVLITIIDLLSMDLLLIMVTTILLIMVTTILLTMADPLSLVLHHILDIILIMEGLIMEDPIMEDLIISLDLLLATDRIKVQVILHSNKRAI